MAKRKRSRSRSAGKQVSALDNDRRASRAAWERVWLSWDASDADAHAAALGEIEPAKQGRLWGQDALDFHSDSIYLFGLPLTERLLDTKGARPSTIYTKTLLDLTLLCKKSHAIESAVRKAGVGVQEQSASLACLQNRCGRRRAWRQSRRRESWAETG